LRQSIRALSTVDRSHRHQNPHLRRNLNHDWLQNVRLSPERSGRLPFKDIRRRKEAGKIPTDDLICSVAFDSFGAGIPTGDPTLEVHRKDGVVLDSIEEHPISLFACAESLLHS
jgi:hypothetical protein